MAFCVRDDAVVGGRFPRQPGHAPGDCEPASGVYRWQWRLLEQWLAEESDWDKAWIDVAGHSDSPLVLTPQSLRAMSDEIWAVVQRYREQAPAGATNAARVVWLQHLVPVRGELPL